MSDVLATLLSLEENVFKAQNSTQLSFIMVNETRVLVPYRQAVFHAPDHGVVAVSGVTFVEKNAPFALFLKRVFKSVEADGEVGEAEHEEWADWLPPHPLFLPINTADGKRLGTLLLAADEAWQEGPTALAQRLSETYAYAWAAQHRPRIWTQWKERITAWPRWKWGVAAAVLLFLLFPVRLSVLAPAEIVPEDPAVIRAPLEGVIESVLVEPNQPVKAGDPLFSLDQTSISGKLRVAQKALDIAKAELDQATQQAFLDPRAKAMLPVLQARVAEKQAECVQLEELMSRAQALAPRDGIAVMDDPSEWIGRPVSVGEKVIAVADPQQVSVQAWLSPADLIPLEDGGPVTLFLNTDPLSPVSAALSYITFEATLQPDGLLAHRVRATITDDTVPRIGLKGTARLDGSRVPLIYWLLRRPLAMIRQWVGL